MRKSHLKTIIKEIVRQTLSELPTTSDTSIVVENEGSVLIENLTLQDGRNVSARVEINGEWISNGIGSYEFWGQKRFDKGTEQWSLQTWNVVGIWDAAGTEISIKDPSNKAIVEEINNFIYSNKDTIENEVNQNPDDQDGPEDYEDRDR